MAVRRSSDQRTVCINCCPMRTFSGTVISLVLVFPIYYYRFFRKTLKYVRLGDLDFDNDDDGAQYQEVNVSEIVKHPDYNASSYYNGIALLKLETPVTFNDFVGPACLQTEKELNRTDKNLVLASWGRFGFACERSSQLLKSSVPLSSQESCNNSYKNANRRRLKNGIDEAQHICAYDPESFCVITSRFNNIPIRLTCILLGHRWFTAADGQTCW